ncbi:MAG TPA: efflux RND transporter periplasmic adaptor subunit [Edaphocola sp.]|nr:efflux RND transporter periplasmic adaptor subunit [Edaphocola sp.]
MILKKYIPLLAGSLLFAACGGNKENTGSPRGAEKQLLEVPTTQLETRSITTIEEYPATVEGVINSEVRAKITGYITQVLVDEGQRVNKGQLLFRVETQSRNEDAQAAKANIQAAQVRVDQLKPLVDQNIISKSQLETAKAQLAQARAGYQSIMADIGYANITSPINGFVGEIRMRQGNLVSPSNPLPLTTVSEINKVYVYFTMNESQYLNFINDAFGNNLKEKIKNLPKVSLILANGVMYAHKGVIQTINSQVDKSSGTISFRAMFDNPEQILTNGSTGTIQIPKENFNKVIVPQQSTYENQDKIMVMKVEKSDSGKIAHAIAIEIGDKTTGVYIVESGLAAGDEIIVKGANKIPDGSKVKGTLIPFDSATQSFTPVFEK